MNRPPTPKEYLGFEEWCDVVYKESEECDKKQDDAMQEALTAEWLIEHGLMPDPTELTAPWWLLKQNPNPNKIDMVRDRLKGYTDGTLNGWSVEDRDPDGKPENYRVRQ